MASTKTVIAFDLYGTLLSTESIAGELAKLFGDDKAKTLAASWRRYQLEYTWRINSMGIYRTFSEITQGALHHAVEELGLSVSSDDEKRLMDAYAKLHVFPEVPAALDLVRARPDVDALIFSNGNEGMVTSSVDGSPDLTRFADVFKGLVSVDPVQVFKPDLKTYHHLLEHVGKTDAPGEVWLVTANPFDVVGATVAGVQAAWIDRAGTGWVDRLGAVIGGASERPALVVSGVDEAVRGILSRGT
ncbi:haloacid dehalogenase [Echria macrotheca]|uniref:Haloacid dehalogenase n=1 Tax=Echria macrotheca TaxID=438768 RepID=A0AAJ0F6T8_9PEZI|nr:haloacid dehalogenase [Echria macrotheca]